MATGNNNPHSQRTIELTEVESTLKRLLLDVATYIDPTAPCELRYTGGWVRDKLLGLESHDIDVAIDNLTGEQFGLKMKEYLEISGNAMKYGIEGVATTDEVAGARKKLVDKNKIVAGLHKIEANPEKSKHLETVTTKIFGLDIDLVNLRKETYAVDSRTPQMTFGTPEEDALRRDATINAMFYNLQTGLVEDFTNRGMEDIAQNIIRTPLEPYQTFTDDPLRVLRLIRFASRLNYTIESTATAAMRDESIKEALKLKISRERIGVELEKMLKGPDPHHAFKLIENAGLYNTIFTDPTTDLGYSPLTDTWRQSYELVAGLTAGNSPQNLCDILLPDQEHKYIAWLHSAFVPWFDAPPPPPARSGGKASPPAAVLVAREGVKTNNKISDIVGLSLRYAEEISNLKTRFIQARRMPNKTLDGGEDPSGRDTLGMAIRKWGHTWRSQAIFTIMLETTRSSRTADDILHEWSDFLGHLQALDLLSAYDFKPVVDGNALVKALNTKPGRWMKDALDVVMAWQLRNPDTATAEGGIEALRNKQGELTAVLVRHFLQLTIRPLFAKTQKQPNVTAHGRKEMATPLLVPRNLDSTEDEASSRPWKEAKEAYALELLQWALVNLNHELTQQNWPLLIPPLLTLLDDTDVRFKVLGCELVKALLDATAPALLSRTGLGDVFQEAIEPSLSYLPSLTPEQDSITLLNAAYPAMLKLGNVCFLHSASQRLSDDHVAYLVSLLHSHILPSISHVSDDHPRLTSALLIHLRTIVDTLGTDTISQLPHLLPMLTNLMTIPFIAAEPVLLLESTKTIQAIIASAWPRMWFWHGEVLQGLCQGWIIVLEERDRWTVVADKKKGGEGAEMLKSLDMVSRELQMVAQMLLGAVEATNDVSHGAETQERVDVDAAVSNLLEAEPKLEGLFRKLMVNSHEKEGEAAGTQSEDSPK